jgi:hypothetical protein
VTSTASADPAVAPLQSVRAVVVGRLDFERAVQSYESWDMGYQTGLRFAITAIDFAINDQEQRTLPVINADVLGRAIAEHRQAEFEPHQHVLTHLCFDDCAEDIYARCLRLIAE